MDFISKNFDFIDGDRCITIGEVGVNHNNDENLLFKLIDAGIESGLDIIKFQRFKSEDEISIFAPSAQYQKDAGVGEKQLEMAKALELSDKLLVQAYEYCKNKGVGFLCTAFDHGSVDFLADKLKCKTVKVPSPEITNKPLIQHMARKFDALIVSTGASNMAECARVLDWIHEIGSKEIALMHCTSQYPAPLEQANFKVLETFKKTFNLPIGYSDHTEGVYAGVVCATMGASMIEKHYTLDKNLPGPDHKASANISELKELVKVLKVIHQSLGDGVKMPVDAEQANLPLIRKCLTNNLEDMKEGTVITRDMLGIKRPQVSGAVEPFDLEKVIGMRIKKSKKYDEPILWSDFQ